MKKVLIAIPNIFGGGAERVASLWANSLRELGYQVAFLNSNYCDKEYPIDTSIQRFVLANTYAEYKSLGTLKTLSMIRKIVKDYRPDVLINFLPHWQIAMMFATWGLKVKKIETVRNSPWSTYPNSKLQLWLWKKCFSRSKSVIVQANEQALFFNKRIQKKCITISNPIDKRYETSFKTEYANNIKNFVAVGRIDKQKNYPLMIQAFSELIDEGKDLTLSIYGVGKDDYTAKMQALIDQSGHAEKIKLMGRTSNVDQVFINSDAFIMTSNHEGMPNALLEAMVAKLPCISTDCRTGPKDMIDDGINGFLAKTGDLESVKSCIRKVLELDKEKSQEIGEKAREKIYELCSEQNSLEKLSQLINDCEK